jgi:hypothetical protein
MCILLSGKFHKHFLPGLALHHQNNEVLMSEDLDPDKEKMLTQKQFLQILPLQFF